MAFNIWKNRSGLFSLSLWLAVATQAGGAMATDQFLSVEAPVVQKILRRAIALEGQRGDEQQQHAAHLYCMAARLGSLEAQYRLGKMIQEGRGMTSSIEGATTLFSIAAGNGHEVAGALLGETVMQPDHLPECLGSTRP